MASLASTFLAANLLTEWDARDLSLSDNDPVTTWTKSTASTEGNNLTQSTAENKPLYKTGTYPYLQFDGTNDSMSAALPSSPKVHFSVCECTSDGTNRAIGSMFSAGNYAWYNVATGILGFASAGTTPQRTCSFFTWPDATKIVVAAIVRSSSVGILADTGGQLLTVTAIPSLAGTITVGAFNSGQGYFWSGKIYHTLVTSDLSYEEIIHTMALLRSDWGITGDDALSGGGVRIPNINGGADQ